MQCGIEQMGCRSRLEQFDKCADDELPFLRAEFSDIAFQKLLKARRPYPSEGIVLCLISAKTPCRERSHTLTNASNKDVKQAIKVQLQDLKVEREQVDCIPQSRNQSR